LRALKTLLKRIWQKDCRIGKRLRRMGFKGRFTSALGTEEASAYLETVLEDGDSGAWLFALRDIIDARGGVSE